MSVPSSPRLPESRQPSTPRSTDSRRTLLDEIPRPLSQVTGLAGVDTHASSPVIVPSEPLLPDNTPLSVPMRNAFDELGNKIETMGNKLEKTINDGLEKTTDKICASIEELKKALLEDRQRRSTRHSTKSTHRGRTSNPRPLETPSRPPTTTIPFTPAGDQTVDLNIQRAVERAYLLDTPAIERNVARMEAAIPPEQAESTTDLSVTPPTEPAEPAVPPTAEPIVIVPNTTIRSIESPELSVSNISSNYGYVPRVKSLSKYSESDSPLLIGELQTTLNLILSQWATAEERKDSDWHGFEHTLEKLRLEYNNVYRVMTAFDVAPKINELPTRLDAIPSEDDVMRYIEAIERFKRRNQRREHRAQSLPARAEPITPNPTHHDQMARTRPNVYRFNNRVRHSLSNQPLVAAGDPGDPYDSDSSSDSNHSHHSKQPPSDPNRFNNPPNPFAHLPKTPLPNRNPQRQRRQTMVPAQPKTENLYKLVQKAPYSSTYVGGSGIMFADETIEDLDPTTVQLRTDLSNQIYRYVGVIHNGLINQPRWQPTGLMHQMWPKV